jgi:hypothetical protein
MADQMLCSGVACITDLMVKERLVNLDFVHVCSIMSEMGTAMIGTQKAMGERRALRAPKAAIANPLLATPITPPSSPADRLSKRREFPNPCGGFIYSAANPTGRLCRHGDGDGYR